ncbi:hypothetical protein LTR70_003738 [Exophiala xenobiotica]|uniref:dipeptidyl-peptidase IV n=1 Tax=Lithohypha guttulata TaxID=1690604 RepID=A0ABR0KI33_9EURO|nr:hypothetical protein LTR24_002302 [Lithohypha guttulata]KAK5322790.1 hypothetical protein LTR70_003738 [Exophiala xenobiotica]
MGTPQPITTSNHSLDDASAGTSLSQLQNTKTLDFTAQEDPSTLSPRRRAFKPRAPSLCTGSSTPSPAPSPRSATTSFRDPWRSPYRKTLPTATMSPREQDLLEDSEKGSLLRNSPSSSSQARNSISSPRSSFDSTTSVSTTSLVLENLNTNAARYAEKHKPSSPLDYRDDESDPELPSTKWSKHKRTLSTSTQTMSRTLKRLVWLISIIALVGWIVALYSLLSRKAYQHSSTKNYDHEAPGKSSGRKISLESIQQGQWYPRHVNLNWIAGANDEDGLLLEISQPGKDFMVVEDVRARKARSIKEDGIHESKTLMKSGQFVPHGGSGTVLAEDYWPSPDLTKVLVLAKREKVYRHSFTGVYYVFDVQSQTAEYLDASVPDGRVQLASWSPKGDAIVFTRDNDLFVRLLKDSSGQSTTAVRQVTKDGGPEFFYGIPDWVYEEEVFQGNDATWWDREGKFVAFMRTNETMVHEFPVDYYLSRPTGVQPEEGLENYPDEKRIKYPKAGSPNPVVDMLFYDLEANEMFDVSIDGGFGDDDRIIGDVLWAADGRVIVKELNRVSDKVRVVLVDVKGRTGKTIRTLNVQELDGGWVESGQESKYIPADPDNGRPHEGYIDMVIYDDSDHLGYFSPLDNPEPLMLTKGKWEVEQGSVTVDLKNNLVYFTAAKEHSTQRHIYSVDLEGKDLKPLVPTERPGYYTAEFSAKAGYAIINYNGPSIPSQKVISTPSNPNTYEEILEDNKDLAKQAAQHEMPHLIYTNITAEDGTVLNVLEQRPPHFDPKRQYPVLFQLYGGPGSQQVDRRFKVNFQSYVASTLGYLVVTVDGRGTGFIGRKARTLVRGNLGHFEALDQITAAKEWSSKPYVDADRLAIWGWSYGGFMTLKVLETDAGEHFKYGMAVAPVTDWRFYDSIYTERYMLTPGMNVRGYDSTAITNVTALSQNVRWLMMHGTGDDNVHMQNTLTLIDKLDLAGVKNYDVHFFPDSDHGIYFHGANDVVYGKLSQFLVNAFNGQFYKMRNPSPAYVVGVDDEAR